MRSRPATIAAVLLIAGLLTTALALAVGTGSDRHGPTQVRADVNRGRPSATTTTRPTTTTSTTAVPEASGSGTDTDDLGPTLGDEAPAGPTTPRLHPSGPLAAPLPLFGAGTSSPTPGEGSSVRLVADPAAAGVAADFTVGGMPAPSAFDPGFGYTAGQGGCSLSCITSGVAYPAARDAALRVETNTPARIWIAVWRGSDTWMQSTVGSAETTFTANFDDLLPNTTYQAMAVAQDAHGFADHRYGSFTTRGEKLKLTLDDGAIYEIPDDGVRVPEDVSATVWVNGTMVGDFDSPLPLLDPSAPVDVRVKVVASHEDLADDQGWGLGCAASGGLESAPTSPGAFDASTCITWITVANWTAGGQIAPISMGGATSKEVTLTIAPDFDVDFVVTFGLTLQRVPA